MPGTVVRAARGIELFEPAGVRYYAGRVPDPDLDELWRRITAAWDDDAAHAAFLERCRAAGKLGVAAARYREELRREDRKDSAKKRLDALTALAFLELEARRTPPEVPQVEAVKSALKWLTVALFVAALAFAAVQVFSG